METKSPLEAQIRLTIVTADSPEHGVFGKGGAVVLRGVQLCGSLNKAAKELGMAYSKAWTLMRDTEEMFGIKLINRDGARGSTLTEDGAKLLAVYDQLQKEVAAYAQERLAQLLND